MYGAMMIAWSRRYTRNASLDHRPIVLTTSKGTPCRRSSRVAPIHMPWPWKHSISSVLHSSLRVSMKASCVRERRPFGWCQEKMWSREGGLFMLKWLSRAACGSDGPGWVDQNTSSPSREDLMTRMWNTVNLRLLQSVRWLMFDLFTCCSGWKNFRVGTVNSPKRASE
jgi:hypothetical protein